MPTIKITSGGKVILKDGKVSCQCCSPIDFCDYRNNWGPGYDELPDTVTISTPAHSFGPPEYTLQLPAQVMTLTRISKCRWRRPPSCAPNLTDDNSLQFSTAFGWSGSIIICNSSGPEWMSKWLLWIGSKGGSFDDGPLGTYANAYGIVGTVT